MVCEIRIGSHILQPDRQLLREGQRVPIGPRALAILGALAREPNSVVTKDELLEAVWPGIVVEENTLQVHVAALRKALGDDGHLIETVRSVGYMLKCEPAAPDSRTRQAATAASESPRALLIPSPRLAAALALVLGGFLLAALLGSPLLGNRVQQVAIVPFEAASGDAQEAALAGGITDELIFRLRRVEDLQVSTATADEAQGEHILQGRLQSDGSRMRLAVRLQDRAGEVLWSDIYDSEIDTLLKVQEEIARNIAGALSVSLERGAESRSYGGTDNAEAYANYVQGRINRQNPDRQVPTAYLERALALDPDYPKALTEATFVDGISLYFTRTPAEAERLQRRMDRLSSHALAMAPGVWQSQVARGWHVLLDRDFRAADRFHAVAEGMDRGNDPELLNVLANYHAQLGRSERASRFRRAKAMIDPIFDAGPLPEHELYAGNFDRVIAMYDNREDKYLVDLDPYSPVILYWALRLSGRTEAARRLARAEGGGASQNAHFVTMDHTADFPDLPYEQLRRFAQERYGVGGRTNLAERALHASQMGKHRLALDYLELAYIDRQAMGGYYLIWHPALARTRATREFAQWIERLGMVEAWRASGDWGDFCRPAGERGLACR